MCGIVAYIGDQLAGPILFDTLKRLEYRGYDSAGVAIKSAGVIEVLKSAGRIADLEKVYQIQGLSGRGHGHRPYPLGNAWAAKRSGMRIPTPPGRSP